MIVIGITGGIGTGKSTVTEYLTDSGYTVIDADQIARDMTRKGSPVLPLLAEEFGPEILFEDGTLDRKGLAAIVFTSPERKERMESIITARVIQEIRSLIDGYRKEETEDVIFLDAPLLFESGADAFTDLVWLVTAKEETRVLRVMERDGCSREDVLQRIHNQMPEEEKKQLVDEVIDNSLGLSELYGRIDELIVKYRLTKMRN